MVSSRNKILSLLGLMFVFMLFSGTAKALPIITSCTSPKVECCPGGVKSCCAPLATGENYDVSCWMEDRPIGDGIECSEGDVRYKADGCSYKTMNCCPNGKWSDWDFACVNNDPVCAKDKCWNGSSCETKGATSRNCSGNVSHAKSGTQTRTATCNNGSGWSYTSWKGTCTCDASYTWNASTNTCIRKTIGGGFEEQEGPELIGYRWVPAGHNCWDKFECGTDELPECNASLNGTYWSKWDSSYNLGGCGSQFDDRNGPGGCQQFRCTQ